MKRIKTFSKGFFPAKLSDEDDKINKQIGIISNNDCDDLYNKY